MGNYRFRLSDMMPNAWFYKLKDMSRGRRTHSIPHHPRVSSPTTPKPPPTTPHRDSYYYSRPNTDQDTPFSINPPRKSHRRSRTDPQKPPTNPTTVSSNCSCKLTSTDKFDTISDLELPPILTKPVVRVKEHAKVSPRGLRMRTNTPRLASKKLQAPRRSFGSEVQRKRLAQGLAVVKNSSDPQTDFRDSMVEMIVENNIRASEDLEELLASYLVLNSKEYHDVIVKVFEQIWFDLTDIIRL